VPIVGWNLEFSATTAAVKAEPETICGPGKPQINQKTEYLDPLVPARLNVTVHADNCNYRRRSHVGMGREFPLTNGPRLYMLPRAIVVMGNNGVAALPGLVSSGPPRWLAWRSASLPGPRAKLTGWAPEPLRGEKAVRGRFARLIADRGPQTASRGARFPCWQPSIASILPRPCAQPIR